MIFISGAAGFIGFHLAKRLLNEDYEVVGVDNINDYYDPSLKHARLSILNNYKKFYFRKIDICDFDSLEILFREFKIDIVCHLAAQAGVRYSLINPFSYQKSNNEGFLNIIELCRKYSISNFVYASSSSVYGANTKIPFSETDPVDQPVSLYAATKRSNELVAYCYSHLYGLFCSGLRFFTVYGPWGRPDMALFLFTKAILADQPINVFNNGKMIRNFTYIDDIIEGIILVVKNPSPFEIYNIGNDRAETLMDFIEEIEKNLGKKAKKNFLPLQPGDVTATIANIEKIKQLGYNPKTNIDTGIKQFICWYRQYYNI